MIIENLLKFIIVELAIIILLAIIGVIIKLIQLAEEKKYMERH